MAKEVHATDLLKPGPGRMRAAQETWVDILRSPELRFAVRVFGLAQLGSSWDTGWRQMGSHLVYGLAAGSIRCHGEGLPERLDAGGLLWVAAGARHRFTGAGAARLCHFNAVLLRRGRRVRGPETALHAPDEGAAVAELIALRERHVAAHPWWSAQMQAWLTWTYLRLAPRLDVAAGPRLAPAVLARAQAWADERLAQHPTPRQLAAACRLSLGHFARAFRATVGISPRRWLLRRRIAAAAALLEREPLPIARLAERLGYDDPYLFSRQFRAEIGCSPLAFRLQVAAQRDGDAPP